jgi:outer membrane protein assembly factor BamC
LIDFDKENPVKRSVSTHALTALAMAAVLSGCAALEEEKINYKSAAKPTGSLDVPPDLTQLRKDSRYALESNSATASGFAGAAKKVSDAGTAANAMGDVRMERSGAQRWLVVSRPADKVWEPLREFWTANGFNLSMDSADVGIMETDWAENRAKIPQDLIRRTIGRVLDSLYSTGERDKFRTRVERNAQGGVDIYVTHRGMVESFTSNDKTSTTWQLRPTDPELEIEFLRRMMVKLGASPEQAKVATAGTSASAPAALAVTVIDGRPSLKLADDLERAWRKTGVALDRTGFTVEDRDRSKGVYFVRYVPPGSSTEEPGFFAKLFSSKTAGPELTRYRVSLEGQDGATLVRVLSSDGKPDNSDNAQKILKLLAAELR